VLPSMEVGVTAGSQLKVSRSTWRREQLAVWIDVIVEDVEPKDVDDGKEEASAEPEGDELLVYNADAVDNTLASSISRSSNRDQKDHVARTLLNTHTRSWRRGSKRAHDDAEVSCLGHFTVCNLIPTPSLKSGRASPLDLARHV